ncbi:MAG: biopolymer transporter ExbB [Hasllibacter sp.]
MILVLGLVAAGGWLALPAVLPVFLANPWLNGFIGGVFVIGVFATFWQLWQIRQSVRWIRAFAREGSKTDAQAPRLLAPLAALLRQRAGVQIGASSARSILDSVATRIEEARDITRYIVNLLIFLGLLGTFYGLATTVPAVVDTIRSLAPQEGEAGVAVFDRLMTGLEAQLGGMGVAFASSLLGLAGSLVVGLLELFAGHGQNRFYRELEEWLSSITRLGLSGEGEGDSSADVMAPFLDHMAEQMEAMREMFVQADVARSITDDRIAALVGVVSDLTEKLSDGGVADAALMQVAEGQRDIVAAVRDGGAGGLDAESRMRLRSMDVQMLRLLEEVSAGRQESLAALRREMSDLRDALSGVQRPAPPRRLRRTAED